MGKSDNKINALIFCINQIYSGNIIIHTYALRLLLLGFNCLLVVRQIFAYWFIFYNLNMNWINIDELTNTCINEKQYNITKP